MIYPTEKLTLSSMINRPNTALCTFHRDDESVRGPKEDNLVGEGLMIINQDREWFVNYDQAGAKERGVKMGKFVQSRRMTEYFDKLNLNSTTGKIDHRMEQWWLCAQIGLS